MIDLLTRLAARAVGEGIAVRPRADAVFGTEGMAEDALVSSPDAPTIAAAPTRRSARDPGPDAAPAAMRSDDGQRIVPARAAIETPRVITDVPVQAVSAPARAMMSDAPIPAATERATGDDGAVTVRRDAPSHRPASPPAPGRAQRSARAETGTEQSRDSDHPRDAVSETRNAASASLEHSPFDDTAPATRDDAPPTRRTTGVTPRRGDPSATRASTRPAPRDAWPAPPDAARDAPVVHVTIGRVEIRATTPPAPPAARPAPPAAPTLSLGDYLAGRKQGAR